MVNAPVVAVKPGPGGGATRSNVDEMVVAGGPESTVKFNIWLGPPV